MNNFQMLQEIWQTKTGALLNSWSDINPILHGKMITELNNCLQDTWLNNSAIFKQRKITMTCIPEQMNYDVPFNGELKQDGLLLQPISTNFTGQQPTLVKIKYSRDSEKFYRNQQSAQPRWYTFYNNQLLLDPIPDKNYLLTCLYYCFNWAQSVTYVTTPYSGSNVLGQNTLAVDHTQDVDIYGNTQDVYKIGDVVYINKNSTTEETGVISAIDTINNVLTFVGNLTFNHNINERATVERQTLAFATDEPNQPKEFHNIFVYGALKILFFGDSRQQIYADRYNIALANLISNSKQTQSAQDGIRFTECRW